MSSTARLHRFTPVYGEWPVCDLCGERENAPIHATGHGRGRWAVNDSSAAQDRQHLPPDDGGMKPTVPPPKPSDARRSVTAAKVRRV